MPAPVQASTTFPLDRCSEQGIVVFNTPGANANAVAELVIGMLIAGSRNVAAAAQWTQGLAGDPAMAKSVEKGKKQFVGNEIKGKTLGVVGLGAIGSRVANCAIALGMEVYGYDPYISIDAAVEPEQSGAPLRQPERYAASLRLHHHPCALPAHHQGHHQCPDTGPVQGRRQAS